jgi:hypothetical protein
MTELLMRRIRPTSDDPTNFLILSHNPSCLRGNITIQRNEEPGSRPNVEYLAWVGLFHWFEGWNNEHFVLFSFHSAS